MGRANKKNHNNNNSKRKIMIVDDDKEFLEEIRQLLEFYGYEAKSFQDAASALRAARSLDPDLMLLDLKMDGMDGFQLADRLTQSMETSDIPLIAMTGYYTFSEQQIRLMDALGIKAFIKKPFKPLVLIEKIEAVLAENSK
ncbi:MAG: response regulator [Candidatus Omnitrophica bacterium]|nr:response regulator [Candidatus Omnitrophota bacterium]